MITGTASNARLRAALQEIHATITHEDPDGVDFEVEGVPGVAREHGGRFRASYFIAVDPDPTEAAQFAAAHEGLHEGLVQHIDGPGRSAMRLLVELAFEDSDHIWATAHTARALHAAWMNRQQQGTDLVHTLAGAGIAVPPLGPVGDVTVYTYGAWSWGSRYVPPFLLYMFDAGLVMRQLIDRGPFFSMSHAGHGINSYGLNLVTSAGPVAAFVQHGYGGGYADPLRDLVRINATYARLHVLLGATRQLSAVEPRWLLNCSQFRGVVGIVDLDKVRAGASDEEAFEALEDETQLFETIAARLGLRSIDFGTAGAVSW